jgi:PAS domain S-box-containing protein
LRQRVAQLEAEVQRLSGIRIATQAVQSDGAILAGVLNSVPSPIFWKDLHSVYLGCNTLFARAVGLRSPEDIVGLTDFDLPWPRAEAEAYRADDRAVMESGCEKRNIVEPLRQADGTRLWINTTKVPLRDASGRVHGVLGVYEDVTARREAEEALRRERLFADAVVDSVPGLLYLYDEQGHLCRWNKKHEEITGYTSAELAGRHVLDWYKDSPEDISVIRAGLERVMREGFGDAEANLTTKSGAKIRFYFTAVRLEIDGKTYFTGVGLDITRRKLAEEARMRLEQQLRQAQKLEALGTLAGGIAHDFNNILGAIMSYTELARREVSLQAGVQEDLAQVLKACDRARDLVRQILSFSRQNRQERRPLALRPVVSEALKLLRSSLPATIELVQDLQPDLPQVLADPTQIHQILLNLCTNSSHALQGQIGKISVALETFHADASFTSTHPDVRPGTFVRLIVRDNGHGMDEGTLKRAFEPFFTTKGPGEGTGLGLSVVHGIVQEHDGAIHVASEKGQGTTFWVYFPALGAEPEAPTLPAPSLIPGHGEELLVVDDEPALGEVMVRLLSKLGYKPTALTEPHQALALFRENPHRFAAVITDLTMPAVTGIELGQAILAIRPTVPILLCSGFSGTYSPEMAQALGFVDLLCKPMNLQQLSLAVHHALQSRTGAQSGPQRLEG